MARFSAYDVFSGSPDGSQCGEPVWLEAADDLKTAEERIKQLSLTRPGKYFIYSCRAHAVVTQVDTSTNRGFLGNGGN